MKLALTSLTFLAGVSLTSRQIAAAPLGDDLDPGPGFIVQEAFLKSSNVGAGDSFGASVAISGDTLVIGATGEASSAVGVNGDESDNSLLGSGAAYVFVRDGLGWKQQAYLKASNPDAHDGFGQSVAIDGDTIVVGASSEDSASAGVDGDQSDDSLSSAGAAYVFVRNGSTWSQEAYLKASNPGFIDLFGYQLAIDGDTIAVGAQNERSNSPGVNGNQNDDSETAAGAVYVFTRSGTTWSQEAYIKASNPEAQDLFGYSVDIEGDRLVVGAQREDSSATGVNGDQNNNDHYQAGAAYVFDRVGSTWSQTAYLKASNNVDVNSGNVWGDCFGTSVSLSGDALVVGAILEDSRSTGVDGNQLNNLMRDSGSAYVFRWDGANWAQEAYLKASNTNRSDLFGNTVVIEGDLVVIGALYEGSGALGVNGDQDANNFPEAGAAYVFERQGTTWSQQAYLKASNTGSEDNFSSALALSGNTLVSGAPWEASTSEGPNGFQDEDLSPYAGAAYVFNLAAPGYQVPFCFGDGSGSACPCGPGAADAGCPNSASTGARLAGTGTANFEDDTFGLSVTGLPANRIGLCVKGQTQLGGGFGNPIGDGLLCAAVQYRSQPLVSGAGGTLLMDGWRGQPFGTYPGISYRGAPVFYQWYYRDPQMTCTGQGFNFSNALAVYWQ